MWPPTASTSSAIAAALRVVVPLNAMCSRKCETPFSSAVSLRDPEATYAPIETVSTPSLSDSAQIPVANNPVYGVMTSDDRRAFILNQGSGTVSVINVPSNAPDVNLPTITIPP